MDELTFDVTIDEDGRYVAQAREHGIATDGANWDELKAEVQDLVLCFFPEGQRPARSFQFYAADSGFAMRA